MLLNSFCYLVHICSVMTTALPPLKYAQSKTKKIKILLDLI